MKVAVDCHVIIGRPQGSRTVLIELLKAVADMGFAGQFELYSSNAEECRAAIGPGGFTYIEIKATNSLFRLAFVLPKEILRRGRRITLWQYILSPALYRNSIVFTHDVLPLTHKYLFPANFSIRSSILFYISMIISKQIFTISEYSKVDIANILPIARRKTTVLNIGPSFGVGTYFDSSTLPPSLPTEKRYVLTVGRIERRKNIDLLCRAFLAAAVPGVELIVVGKVDLKFDKSLLPQHPTIHYLSDVGDAELIDLYRSASLFVYPSMAEGFGLPLLDALLFGLPVISSDRTAMKEVAGGVAETFDPKAPDAERFLTSAIRRHFQGAPVTRPTLADRKRLSEKFNWQGCATLLMKVVDGIRRDAR